MIKNLLLFLTLLISLAVSAQENSKSTSHFLAELDQKVPQLLHDFSIPGAAIAIIENGEIVLQKGYGYADIGKGIKVNKKTGFNIGSISKTVAAWGVMKLVTEGKIDLDAPASTYLTRWQIPESEFDSDKVSVRRLLSHTAGLSISSVSAGMDYDKLPTLEDWLNGKNDGLGPVEIIIEPGTKGEYSGGGYGVCQLIIEEVTGQKFEDYMQAQVLNPLGMTNSSYKIDDKIRAASASPYDKYGKAFDFELFTVQAGAGLHTTLEDFTRFAFASLYKHPDNSTYNPVLTVDIIQQMMEPVPITKKWAWSYCMGYQALEMGSSSGFRGHGGTNLGWQANFWVNPLSNDGFIVFTNGGAGNIADLVFCRWVTWKSGAKPWDACNPKLSIASKLNRSINEKGIEDIATTYNGLKKQQPDEYDFSESQLNDLGYYYKDKGDLEKSIAIFKINVDAFPYSNNVYDSFGEALLASGDRENAIENYKKSVQLNPENENGIQVLKDLGESTDDLLFKVPMKYLKRLEGEYIGTHDESWRIVVEVNGGVLKCVDKYYKFTLVPIGDDKFVNPRFGALWRFDTADAEPELLFGELSFKKVSAEEKSKNTAQFVNEIDKKIPQLLKDFAVPGAAIAIIENGEVILQKGYGFSDVEKEVMVTTKTGFNIGSISKTIAAWGVMKLVQEGKIDLDAPAENYLTRWHLPVSEYDVNEVTIRRLLSHTAGLSLHGYPGWSPKDTLPTIVESLNGKNNGPGRVEIIMEPGTKYKYSGGGFSILQLIIEEVTGQKFEDYMQAQVLTPLGMTNSSYKIDQKIMAGSSLEYDRFGEVIDFELFTAQAAAGFHTTIEDFTHFAVANLFRMEDHAKYNTVLATDLIQQMMVPVPEAKGRFGYGMGYMIESIPGTSVLLGGHRGSNTGWQAIFNVNPETNDGFIMITNGGAGQDVYHPIFFDWTLWEMGVTLEDWYNSKPPISKRLKSHIERNGIDGIANVYAELKENQSDKYDFSENQLNELGYYYLGRGEFENASATLRINVEAFPNSSNVYDSYGEVLLAQGFRKEAIKNYKKSIKLYSGNAGGVKVLNELGISNHELVKNLSVAVESQVLAGYVGRFQTKSGNIMEVRMDEGLLNATIQEQQLNLIAESTARFQALGDETVVTFFTAATGQKGLWAREKIWKKVPKTAKDDNKNKGRSNPSLVKARSTGDFLVFRNRPSWGRQTDFENVLVELGCNIDLRESSLMADLDLSPYDVIIIPGAQDDEYYNNYISNVERFDEYVANGGTLLMELNNAQNSSITLPRGVTIAPHGALENAILESDHPIFLPFSGKRLIQAHWASSGYLQGVPSDALILAVETDEVDELLDRPTFIEYPYGEGQVIAALQCFHDQDGSGRGPLMESVISYALTKSWVGED